MQAPLTALHLHSWAEDQKAFSEDQLIALHDLLTGSSYCESSFSFLEATSADSPSFAHADA